MTENTVLLLLAFAVSLYYIGIKRNPFSPRPLPPGPPRLPFVGNLFNKPTTHEEYHEWSQKLNSDIICLDIAGSKVVVLDTSEAAFELLDRRAVKYSGRARLPMLNDLMGWETVSFGFLPYGSEWRRCRRLMYNSFHHTAATKFRPHLLKSTRNLLNRFVDFPDEIMQNIRHMAGETIVSITYGLDVQPKDDPYIEIAEHALEGLSIASIPGAFLVDSIRILKYAPEWFPGASFKKKARIWKEFAVMMINRPFEKTKENMASGTSLHCFVSENLQTVDNFDDTDLERAIKLTAGGIYAGGTDSTLSPIGSCILGFLEKPEVLRKAQAQVDKVVKPGYLPDFEDYDSLPYITAITMEVMRWRDAGPIGVPHLLTEDDEYKGYRIPAGTVVIANAWAMLHNDEIYPDPFTFNPDRFIKSGKIDSSVRDPSHATWGFGRRICPGRHVAFSAIWIAIASIVTVFDITKAVDKEGNVVEPTHEYFPTLIRIPKPFKCSIKPRSTEAERLIRASVA